MLSFRCALLLWPRPVRFFVLALALLQFVAPTWHICELGGHVMAGQSMARGAAMHHGDALSIAAQNSATTANDATTPLICFCAAHEKLASNPNAPHLDGIASQNHTTCLALLLQTMPGALAAPPAIFRVKTLVCASFIARQNGAPQIAILRRFRGRAPPMSV
ncbi:hypothetical protein B1R32_101228 [Abditibacterium utsteinense]|uniref:DUF2946 domain-containing protein n=1 Tax=Abditibacterium utsteinense TaxID=1960156 RepID=A0A2S8SXH1_9BACT|nr:hypothetical protein [Abditibacterium utsteinense]PQV65486.1 hypothetical protein B1R32_101228 [Abditibacterium utsteinense]